MILPKIKEAAQPAMKWASELPLSNPPIKSVLFALAAFGDPHDGVCDLSLDELSFATGGSARTVQRALKRMVQMHLIDRQSRLGDTNRYRINFGFVAPTPVRRSVFIKAVIPEELRWRVFERDGFRCLSCGSRTMLRADHISPESKGGPTTFENLQTLCRSCNSRKGARHDDDWRE